MRVKWKPREIAALILEIASPAVSIAVACLLPTSSSMGVDQRLAVVVGGIAIPIVVLQFSLTKSIKTVAQEISGVELKVDSGFETMAHVSPVLESVIRSDNDRLQRFAFRRLDEAYDTVLYAINNNNSGNLKPNEYYEELLYLSSLILRDREENKDKFAGEIWAMTGFAENEWVADEGYERLWSDRLKEMAVANIPTKRLCLIHAELYEMLLRQPFIVPSANDEKSSSFWSFIGFLEDYYHRDDIETNVKHYFLRDSDNDMLSEVRGFFAIKLTNGDMHILYGETVDSNGAITAKVLFNQSEIEKLRSVFNLYTREPYELGKKLHERVKSMDFFDFLDRRGIEI